MIIQLNSTSLELLLHVLKSQQAHILESLTILLLFLWLRLNKRKYNEKIIS